MNSLQNRQISKWVKKISKKREFTVKYKRLHLYTSFYLPNNSYICTINIKMCNMNKLKIGNLIAQIPIIQGGMGVGISLSGLASAVANEGGVGVISSAGLGLLYKDFSSDFLEASIFGLKEEIRKAREKTLGVIGVNVMVAMTNFTDMIKTAISEKVDLITAGAGLPLDLPSFLKKDSTTKLI